MLINIHDNEFFRVFSLRYEHSSHLLSIWRIEAVDTCHNISSSKVSYISKTIPSSKETKMNASM